MTPTWSPTGNQIAFTSDRTGTPQIWIMNADGSEPRKITSESWCDRPTWSPAPFNEIAYASRTGAGSTSRSSISQNRRQRSTITDGIGSNESPAFSPNGRHVAFTSTRAGKEQIFMIDRDGKNLRQITQGRHEPLSELVAVNESGSACGPSEVPRAVRRARRGREQCIEKSIDDDDDRDVSCWRWR